MNPYQSPATAADVSSAWSGARPLSVKMAVTLLSASFLPGLAKIVYLRTLRHDGREMNWVVFGFLLVLIAYFLFLWLKGLCLGTKWVYVIHMLFAVGAAWSLSTKGIPTYATQWEGPLYLIQSIFQMSAAALLLLPASWRWFYRRAERNKGIRQQENGDEGVAAPQ